MNTLDSPLVSIGMSVRKNQKTVAQSLRSIQLQTYTNWELIVIDDGSTDGTPDVVERCCRDDPRVRLIVDGQALGLPHRLNRLIDESRGELFARMDGDDIAYPQRIERQVDYLKSHPDVDLVGAGAIVFGTDGLIFGKRIGPELHDRICRHPHSGIPLIHPTFLGKMEFFRRYKYRCSAYRCEDQDLLIRAHHPLFKSYLGNLNLLKSQDQDLLLRAWGEARYANVPEILLGYREERLDLKKILISRRFLVRSFVYEFLKRGLPWTAARAVFGQFARGACDVLAISTGLNYRLLRHRAGRTSVEENRAWQEVWSDVRMAS